METTHICIITCPNIIHNLVETFTPASRFAPVYNRMDVSQTSARVFFYLGLDVTAGHGYISDADWALLGHICKIVSIQIDYLSTNLPNDCYLFVIVSMHLLKLDFTYQGFHRFLLSP